MNLKLLSVLIACLCCAMESAFGQHLQGRYHQQNIYDAGLRFEFKGKQFSMLSSGDMGQSLGGGTFTVKNGILRLNFEKTRLKDSSLSIEKKIENINPDSIQFFINIIREDDGKVGYGFMCPWDKRLQLEKIFQTNTKGKSSLAIRFKNSSYPMLINYLVDYNSIIYSIPNIKGNGADISSWLTKRMLFYMEPQIVRYKILKFTKQSINLRRLDKTHELLILKTNDSYEY